MLPTAFVIYQTTAACPQAKRGYGKWKMQSRSFITSCCIGLLKAESAHHFLCDRLPRFIITGGLLTFNIVRKFHTFN